MKNALEFGITTGQLSKGMIKFGETVRKMIEEYLTLEEIEELNNPKIRNKRKKKLIDISNERIALEELYEI